MNALSKDELNLYGASNLGRILEPEQVAFLYADVIRRKEEDIKRFGEEELRANGDYEVVRNLARFGGPYFDLLENLSINAFVNFVLNEKAIVHSYNAIITQPGDPPKTLGHEFHRDMPFFKDTRTSVNLMIPLVDFSASNGSTEYVPSTHLFRDKPSQAFLKQHAIATSGRAGESFALDATIWHRAGINTSPDARPIIVIKYTLAPFKQQIDFCEALEVHLEEASPTVRQRLGWDARVCKSYEEFRLPGDSRIWKSGQYDMSNTDIR